MTREEQLEAVLRRCLNYLENTEGELGVTLESAEAARNALLRYENGALKFSPDGTLLDEQGKRSIFDDVDR